MLQLLSWGRQLALRNFPTIHWNAPAARGKAGTGVRELFGECEVPNHSSQGEQQSLWDALNHLRKALELLDQAQAPPHIAAHVDLAVHQLTEFVETRSVRSSPSIK